MHAPEGWCLLYFRRVWGRVGADTPWVLRTSPSAGKGTSVTPRPLFSRPCPDPGVDQSGPGRHTVADPPPPAPGIQHAIQHSRLVPLLVAELCQIGRGISADMQAAVVRALRGASRPGCGWVALGAWGGGGCSWVSESVVGRLNSKARGGGGLPGQTPRGTQFRPAPAWWWDSPKWRAPKSKPLPRLVSPHPIVIPPSRIEPPL